MTIVSWNDTDFLQGVKRKRRKTARLEYQARQIIFLNKCLEHLVKHNHTWTALWDPDEYIAFNEFGARKMNPETNQVTLAPANMAESGSVLRYIRDFGTTKCISIPRIIVGNEETPRLENETHPYHPRRFDTLRFRYRAGRKDRINGYGKCFLNVASITEFPVAVKNPHRPLHYLCPGVLGETLWKSPFTLYHFYGSWEAYSFRNDSRKGKERNYEAYMERATEQNKIYENAQAQWMPAFVAEIGGERGDTLLNDAGLDPEYNASFKIEEWKLENNS